MNPSGRSPSAFYSEWDVYAAAWIRNLVAAGHVAPGVVSERSIRDLRPEDIVGDLRETDGRPATQAHFFAGIAGWSYALRLAGWPDDEPVWTGSCPCFVAGTTVLTRSGFRAIEQVRVGEEVLTHRGRWRPVTATMRSRKTTRVLKGQGHWCLETTDEHPFLTGAEEWTEARDMAGKYWACVTRIPTEPVPPIPERTWRGKIQRPNMQAAGFWRFVGYWLGDGWVRNGEQVVLCGGHGEEALLRELTAGAGLHGSVSTEKTGSRIRIGSKVFAAWLTEHFGSGAANKQIPPWLLSQPASVLKEFESGLSLADGHEETSQNGHVRRLTTVSRALAIGVRILFNRLGVSAGISFHKPDRECVIEGRHVREQGFYRVTAYDNARSFDIDHLAGWGRVRVSIATQEYKDVYNIAVEEDESYVADGIVVHNCQPFSDAGEQRGFDDERHLWPDLFRLIVARRPEWFFGEQVASPLGYAWFDVVRSDLEGAGYAVGMAVLPAAGVGAPHLRHRIFFGARLVADARGDERGPGRAGRADGDGTVQSPGRGDARLVADRVGAGLEGLAGHGREGDQPGRLDALAARPASPCGATGDAWSDVEWIPCRDGKARPVEPGLEPLAHGVSGRVVIRRARGQSEAEVQEAHWYNRTGALKGFGNAIVPQAAAAFVRAFVTTGPRRTWPGWLSPSLPDNPPPHRSLP